MTSGSWGARCSSPPWRVKSHFQKEDIKRLGGPDNAAAILGRNVLGWFDREPGPDGRKYLYRVNQKGLEALDLYSDIP